MIPGPIKRALSWIVGAVGFGLLAHALGKREGRQKAATARADANVKAAQRAKETRYETETSDDQRLIDILSGKLHDRKR
jgi:hypothetical protein